MTESKRIKLIIALHVLPKHMREVFLKEQLTELNIVGGDFYKEMDNILGIFNNSIIALNSKQLENLINDAKTNFQYLYILRKLDVYHIDLCYVENIMTFLKRVNLEFSAKNEFIEILTGKIEATKQNLITIIKQGWVGDWDSNPVSNGLKSIKLSTSKNGDALNKRHSLIAKISSVEPIEYIDKIRYRVYISNPKLVNF